MHQTQEIKDPYSTTVTLSHRHTLNSLADRRETTLGKEGGNCPKPRPCPPNTSAHRCKKEHSVAFKIRPDPAGGTHDAPPDPLVRWGGNTPPHTSPTRRFRRLNSPAFGARHLAPRSRGHWPKYFPLEPRLLADDAAFNTVNPPSYFRHHQHCHHHHHHHHHQP